MSNPAPAVVGIDKLPNPRLVSGTYLHEALRKMELWNNIEPEEIPDAEYEECCMYAEDICDLFTARGAKALFVGAGFPAEKVKLWTAD